MLVVRGVCVSIAVFVTISSRKRPKRENKLDMARDSDKEGNFERSFFGGWYVCMHKSVHLEVWGRPCLSSLISLHFIYQGKISQLNPKLPSLSSLDSHFVP